MPDPHSKKPEQLTETDFADHRAGRNSLKGNDQDNLQNQRKTTPDAKVSADEVIESFEKIDKDRVRARTSGKEISPRATEPAYQKMPTAR
jgi:hypothetical protein